MTTHKNRKVKSSEYEMKYSGIPLDQYGRLNYMCDKYNIGPDKFNEILEKRNNVLASMRYYDLDIISLYEEPEGTGRPRFRLINRSNFHVEALTNSAFVHVYSLNAKDDFLYMQRLKEQELLGLQNYVTTPCSVEYFAYFKTPSYLNVTDTFLAEIGLFRPPMDKPDFDNVAKKYSDMYNHNVWLDDTLVIDGAVHKYFSILPRVEIKLKYLNCVYNKNMYNRIVNRKDFDPNIMSLQYLDNKGRLN